MSNPTKLQAIVSCKCPRCRKGEIFSHNALALKKLGTVHELCPVCKFRYEIEPGFFWASMYISYAINVGIMLFCGLLVKFILDPDSIYPYLVPTLIAFVLAFPFTMRYSRVLLLYFFADVRYDSSYGE